MAPTLTHIIGFEARANTDTTPSGTPYWNVINDAGNVFSHVAGRNGGWALQFLCDGVNVGGYRRNITAQAEIVISAWGKSPDSAIPAVNSDLLVCTDAAGTSLGRLSLEAATGTLRATAAFGTADLSNIDVMDGEWHLIEWHLNPTASPYVITWYVDRVLQGTATGTGTAGLQIGRITFGSNTAAHTAHWVWDDVMISATPGDFPLSSQTGSGNDLWVQGLNPNGNGPAPLFNSGSPVNSILNEAGNTTNCYLSVDDWATGDADITTYITYTTTVTGGAASNWADVAFANMDGGTLEVWGVAGAAACFNSTAAGNAMTVRISDGAGTQLTDVVGGNINLTPAGTLGYYTAIVAPPSGGWLAGLNSVSARIGFSTDTNPLPRVSAVVLEAATAVGAPQTVTLPSVLDQHAVPVTPTPTFIGSKTVALGLVDQSATPYTIANISQIQSFYNDFDQGPNGTTISPANSGGGQNDAFPFVTLGVGSTAVYDTGTTLHGASSAAFNPAAGVLAYTEWRPAIAGAWFGRIYLNMSVLPPNVMQIINIRDSGTATNRGIVSITTSGQVRLVNAAGTTVGTTTATITAGSWSRIEVAWTGNATTGSIEAKLFNTVESTTATETLTVTNTNTGGTVDRIRVGQCNPVVGDTAVFRVDNMEFRTDAYPGPWFATAQTVTLPSVLDNTAVPISSTPNFIRSITLPSVLDQHAVTTTAPTFSVGGGTQSVGELPLVVVGGGGWGADPWGSEWGGAGVRTFAPNFIRSITLPSVLDQSATTFDLIFTPKRLVTLPSVLNYTATVIDANFIRSIALEFVDNAAVTFDITPSLEQTVTLPSVLDQSATTFEPTFNPQTVTLDLVSNLAVPFQLISVTIANQNVTLTGLVLSEIAVFPPTFFVGGGKTVTLDDLIDQSATVYELDEVANADAQTVTLDLIDQEAVAVEPREFGPSHSTMFKRGKYSPLITGKRGKYTPTIYKRGREDPQA